MRENRGEREVRICQANHTTTTIVIVDRAEEAWVKIIPEEGDAPSLLFPVSVSNALILFVQNSDLLLKAPVNS